MATQFLRVKSDRLRLLSFNADLREFLKRRTIDPGSVVPEVSENDAKHYTAGQLERLKKRFSKCLFEREWLLQRTTPNTPFHISDSPVTLHRLGPANRRRLSIDSPDTEIFLPIDKKLSLHFVSPHMSRLLAIGLLLADTRHVDMPQERSLAQAIKTGQSDDLHPENVAHQNSLQVLCASRFVFSPKDDFDVAEKIIDKNPHRKFHPKWILS